MQQKLSLIARISLGLGLVLLVIGSVEQSRNTVWRSVSRSELPLDGTAINLMSGTHGNERRLTLDGTIHCSYDGRLYDAVFTFSSNGESPLRHGLFELPSGLELISSFPDQHRYVFKVRSGIATGELRTLCLRLKVEKLVDSFLITPSEVVSSLSGHITGELTQQRAGISGAIPMGAVLFLVGASLSWRRRAFDDDLRDLLAQVRRSHRQAINAIPRRFPGTAHIRQELRELRLGAVVLAKHIQRLRDTIRMFNRSALKSQIARLEQVRVKTDHAQNAERAKTILERCELLSILEQLANRESISVLRLRKVLAALEASHMRLRSILLLEEEPASEDDVMIDARLELDALSASNVEIARFDRLAHRYKG